jgi:hypothetical protein
MCRQSFGVVTRRGWDVGIINGTDPAYAKHGYVGHAREWKVLLNARRQCIAELCLNVNAGSEGWPCEYNLPP